MTSVLALDLARNSGWAVVDGSETVACGSWDLDHGIGSKVPLDTQHVMLVQSLRGAVLVAYARRCVADSLRRGEAPLASHLLYTQPGVLRDELPEERRLGIDAGLSWYDFAEACVVYADRGISAGMEKGIELATVLGVEIEWRMIGDAAPTRWERLKAWISQ